MSEEYHFTKKVRNENGEEVYEYEASSSPRPSTPAWKVQLIKWSIIVGGIAVGTLLFLLFLTLFVYVFLPVLAVLSLWGLFRYWQFKRTGKW